MAYLYPWSYCLVDAGFTQTNGKQWELTSQCCSALKVFCVWQHQNRKNQTCFVSQLKLKIDFLKQPYVRGVTFFQSMILDIHVDFPIIFDIYVKFLGCLSTEPKCLPFIHSWISGSYRILWCFCFLISKVTKVYDVMPGSGWGLDVEKICFFWGGGGAK